MANHGTESEEYYILKQNPDGTWRRLRPVEEGFVLSQFQGAVVPKTNASGVNGNTAITNLPREPVAMLTKTLAELKLKQDDDDRKRYELKKLKIQRRELESIQAHMKKREKDQLNKTKQMKDVIKELEELEDALDSVDAVNSTSH